MGIFCYNSDTMKLVNVPTQTPEEAEKLAQAAQAKNAPHCPSCGSTNIQVVGQNRKAFSAGKAVGGALLAGGVGLLAGFAGKKSGVAFVCLDCGKQFVRK